MIWKWVLRMLLREFPFMSAVAILKSRGGWMTYEDDTSVVEISMVVLVVDSVVLLLDRAMGELKA